MANAEQVVNAVMAQCWAKGESLASQYNAKSSAALSAVSGVSSDVAGQPVAQPVYDVVEPLVEIPATLDPADIVDYFNTHYPELMDKLSDMFAAFLTTYFADDGAFIAARQWLEDAIVNPDNPLPTAIATQIWEDDRARIYDESRRKVEETTAMWAAKGFPLPPGAAAASIAAIEMAAQNELAKSSRTVAIKSADMSYDKIKFAVERALDLKKLAMAAAGDYIKSLTSAMDVSSRMMGVGYDAQARLISAAAAFFNARIEAEKLQVGVENMRSQDIIERGKLKAQIEAQKMDTRVKVMMQDAQVTGQAATSLFNNMHVSAGISGSTSYGVSYAYKNDTTDKPPALRNPNS